MEGAAPDADDDDEEQNEDVCEAETLLPEDTFLSCSRPGEDVLGFKIFWNQPETRNVLSF